MSATGEVVKANVELEQPMTEVDAEEQSVPVEKPVKEKKPKAPKEKKPRPVKNASHPSYFEMIKEALLALKEKDGSSPYAIGKYMEEKHKAALPENFRKILGLQLKNSVSKGKLIRVKASYKLSESGKKDKAATKAPKTTVAAKKQLDQAKSVAAKSASKEKPAKKSLAVKPAKKSETVKKKAAKEPAAAATRSKAKAVQKTKKRAAPAKAKAKQPKSIKSSPAKKAKKVAA